MNYYIKSEIYGFFSFLFEIDESYIMANKMLIEKSFLEAIRKIVLTAGFIAVLFPVLWLLKTSFIENQETLGGVYWMPKSFTLDNYLHPLIGRFESIDGKVNINTSPQWPSVSFFVGLVINGLIVSVSVTLLSIVLAIFTGYGFSRFRFCGNPFRLRF